MTLIERLQQADGPSRELDAGIARHIGLFDGTRADYALQAKAIPAYTASLDAAMMLVDVSRYDYEIRKTYAHIFNRVGKREDYEGRAATPALALCIAALSAQEASNG